jgi:SET domain-containing protein
MPYLDFINHNAENPNSELQVLETKVEEESFYALQAIRPISKGKQITISYGTGQDSTLELFSNYGFIPPKGQANPNDRALMTDDKYRDHAWSTTLKEDEKMLEELLSSEKQQGNSENDDAMKKILQFRIRMIQAANK